MNKVYQYSIIVGNDEKHYAVFKDAYEAEMSEHMFVGCRLACCNGYDNAFELNSDWFYKSGRTKAGNSIS